MRVIDNIQPTTMHMADSHKTPLPRAQRKAIAGNGTMIDSVLMEAGANVGAHRYAHHIRGAVAKLCEQAHVAACVACHRPLCVERPIGGILLAFAVPRPRATSASPICLECWAEPISELSRHAEIALRRIVPQGNWLDPAPPDSG